MANYRNANLFFFFFAAAMMLPTIFAGKGREDSGFVKVDEYVRRRADNATKAALLAYNPNPELVTDQFNQQVGEALVSNSTRRGLMSNTYRDCQAANPIDMCWRCQANWAQNRQQLAECARGFGRKALGGYGGKFYVVTDPSDDDVINPKPGTLRHAVIQEEPLWIIFNKSMVIKLDQELMINSFKTIDGRGVSVAIAYGAGLTIQFVTNVIIHGIRIHHIISRPGGMIRDTVGHFGLRTVSDGDGISIYGSSQIWIDHVSLAKCTDGLIDAIMASNAITISNCQFNNHNDVILLGASDAYKGDSIMQVTVAFNRFGKGLIQRMPRCRWGFFHVVNNLYSRWEMYAIGGSMGPTILSQGNRFKASDNPFTKQVTKRENQQEDVWKNWIWKSEADEFLNGAYFVESGIGGQFKENAEWLESKLQHKPGSYSPKLTRSAGALKCLEGLPC